MGQPRPTPDQEAEWERLDAQGISTDAENRSRAGMTHHPEDIQRREVPRVVESNRRPSPRPPKDARHLSARGKLIADKGPVEVAEAVARIRHQPLTDEERLIGLEQSRAILARLKGESPPDIAK